MAAIAGNQKKKLNYSARGKINPYAASAIGIDTGKLKNTGDLLRMGAVLGMTGSFDDDDGTTGNYPVDNVVIEDDPLFSVMNYTHKPIWAVGRDVQIYDKRRPELFDS